SKMALDFVHGRDFPTRGLFSSQGVYHPPAMVYVVAVPYAVSSHPLVAVVFVTLWNVVGVALLYRIAHFCFGKRAAALAALCYAASPWALLYSHKPFPQDFHTPFLLFGVWFGLWGFIGGKKWAQTLSIPLFFLAPQIHLAGLTLVPLALYFVWVGRKKIFWPGVAAGVLLAFVMIVPFLVDLKEKDVQQFKALVAEEKDSGQGVNTLAVRRMFHLAAGLQLENYFTNDVILPGFEQAAGWRSKILWSLLGLMMLVGMGAVWQKPNFAPLIIGWAMLPVLVTSTGAFFPLYHYLNLILPALFLLIGVGVDWLSRFIPLKKITLPVMGATLALILV
ncbi:MAG: glycosyltransferase family 39 protein, partial [Anaerolineae bacterium]|nr:glycosyltransferase family 39 protein [Anaerolineae bacterium]